MRSDAPYVQVHADLYEHAKLLDLCDLLMVTRVEAAGHLFAMWHWCAKNSPMTGKLPATTTELAQAMIWKGDPDQLYRALVAAHWIEKGIDGSYAHEWCAYGGDQQAKQRKRDFDRQRLARLTAEEQMALQLPGAEEKASINELPEAVQVHTALYGEDEPVGRVNLRRIERVLEEFSTVRGVDVALEYAAWQLTVAQEYRQSRKAAKPHANPIRGWRNQMSLNLKKGWNLRDQPGRQSSPVIDVDEAEIQAYHAKGQN